MYNAPSVSYPVGRSAFYGWCLVGIGLAGWLAWGSLHAMVHWGQAAPLTDVQSAFGLLICGGWTAVAVWQWRQSPQGQLHWDAGGMPAVRDARPGLWRWQPAGRTRSLDVARVRLVLDGQAHCLLRMECPGAGARWLWVDARQDPRRWDDLRRALVAAR